MRTALTAGGAAARRRGGGATPLLSRANRANRASRYPRSSDRYVAAAFPFDRSNVS
jgi:hypothetical protein